MHTGPVDLGVRRKALALQLYELHLPLPVVVPAAPISVQRAFWRRGRVDGASRHAAWSSEAVCQDRQGEHEILHAATHSHREHGILVATVEACSHLHRRLPWPCRSALWPFYVTHGLDVAAGKGIGIDNKNVH